MQIQILTPSGKIFEGEGTSVRVPGTGGQFEVLENHAAIVSSLDPGTIRIILADGSIKNVEIQSDPDSSGVQDRKSTRLNSSH